MGSTFAIFSAIVEYWSAVRVNTLQARQILGLPERFSRKELSSAYKKAARENHPDVGAPSWRFRAVREAFEYLSAPNADTPRAQSASEVLNRKPSSALSTFVFAFVVAIVLCIYVGFELWFEAPARIESNRSTETAISATEAGGTNNDWSRLEEGMSQIQVEYTVGPPEFKSFRSDILDINWEYWLYPFDGNPSLNRMITFRDGSMQHVRVVSHLK